MCESDIVHLLEPPFSHELGVPTVPLIGSEVKAGYSVCVAE